MYNQLIITILIIFGGLMLVRCSVKKSSNNSKIDKMDESVQSENEPNELPEDIVHKLRNDYQKENEYKESIAIINHIKKDNFNVGWIQLCRAIILIANGDISKMKEIVESKYYGDPRDVIMQMMRIPGVKNDHGMTPFEMN